MAFGGHTERLHIELAAYERPAFGSRHECYVFCKSAFLACWGLPVSVSVDKIQTAPTLFGFDDLTDDTPSG